MHFFVVPLISSPLHMMCGLSASHVRVVWKRQYYLDSEGRWGMMEEGRWVEFLEWLDASGLMDEKVGPPAALLRQKDKSVVARCGVLE